MDDLLRDRRGLWLLASVIASLSFYFARDALAGPALLAAKGLPVALLAGWAWTWRELPDAGRIAIIMALGALGDVLVDIELQWGALAFLAGHIAAIALYLRHRRVTLSPSQKAMIVAFLVLTPVIAFLLPYDRAMAFQTAVYAASVGGMAASAWASRFPRNRVGLGAVLFVVSDLLIFARIGPLATSAVPDVLVWPLYYTGQLLICTGAIRALRAWRTML